MDRKNNDLIAIFHFQYSKSMSVVIISVTFRSLLFFIKRSSYPFGFSLDVTKCPKLQAAWKKLQFLACVFNWLSMNIDAIVLLARPFAYIAWMITWSACVDRFNILVSQTFACNPNWSTLAAAIIELDHYNNIRGPAQSCKSLPALMIPITLIIPIFLPLYNLLVCVEKQSNWSSDHEDR